MSGEANVTGKKLRTPKAVAIAGILFSILTIVTFWLLRTSFPTQAPLALETLNRNAATITLAVSLVPFAGVAFLWFIGVLRDRLGHREDQFFATVFLGSGLLFVAVFFVAAAIVGSIVAGFAATSEHTISQEVFIFIRTLPFVLMNVFAIKMAAVFMISTSVVINRTGAAPRYLAYLGGLSGLFILIGSQFLDWSFFVFPIWVLLFSAQILTDNFRRPAKVQPESL